MNTVRIVVTGLGAAVRGLHAPEELLKPSAAGGPGTDPVGRLTGRGLRYRDRATKLAMVAGRDALASAGLTGADGGLTVPSQSVGTVVSTNFGNVDTVCETVETIARESYLGTSPMLLPATSSNVVASWLAITHSLRGANLTLCNGRTSGLDAVNWARLLVGSGRVERVLVAGVEPDNPAVRHLAPEQTEFFDGAAALVVESVESAASRGVRPLAELGPYARRAGHAGAVADVREQDPRTIGLWCVPEHPEGIGAPAPTLGAGAGTAQVHDLSQLFGPSSGALGVLQCVAATAWLDSADSSGRDAGSVVLATAGTGDAGQDDAAAALILAPAGSA
ncbi:beta-ketoacyl synthase [Streptomyces sp. ISL-96]|uniref:beta-ketoacyl synthase N-terminal-like domain-containing protein n=1 Tax=Streptomyces sp. ISL-96 TaxID=2819191 RepID=UPI001BE71FFA|nr:beta-ketoacyl synthase N-terminal-like domain-containing protein [Streptomyces sp. ISL-96]MBT2491892.1 beta-ketoacyl synthase [Streptomyces sp. ISL-96]